MGLLRNKVLTAIIVVVGGVLYATYHYLDFQEVVVPQNEAELKTLTSQIDQTEIEVKRLKEFASNIPAVKQSLKEQTLQLEAILESIPRKFEFNALLKICNQIASNSGVELLKFRPGARNSQDRASSNTTKTESFFQSVSVELTLTGGFLPMMLFLDQISKIKRLISFKEVQMTAKKAQADEKIKSKTVNLDISVVLETYSLGDA